jgi:hypothetical protein
MYFFIYLLLLLTFAMFSFATGVMPLHFILLYSVLDLLVTIPHNAYTLLLRLEFFQHKKGIFS